MARLVISLATRGRPQQLLDTIKRSVVNWTHPDTVMVVHGDNDDKPTLELFASGEIERLGKNVLATVFDREDTIAAKWNRALAMPADLYLVAADDDPYVTPGYDSALLEAASYFPDGIGMVYGRMANASFSGVVAPTRGLVDKLGHIFPEYFPYWFCDHWTDDVAKMIDRISFCDVHTDQSHAGKTQEMREPAWWATFFDAAYLVRRKIARQIIDSPDFQEPEWRKEILRRHHPLTEYRSRWINENVRAQAKQLESWSALSLKDERYQRVKERAKAMVPHLLEGMEANEARTFLNLLLPPQTVVNMKQAYA